MWVGLVGRGRGRGKPEGGGKADSDGKTNAITIHSSQTISEPVLAGGSESMDMKAASRAAASEESVLLVRFLSLCGCSSPRLRLECPASARPEPSPSPHLPNSDSKPQPSPSTPSRSSPAGLVLPKLPCPSCILSSVDVPDGDPKSDCRLVWDLDVAQAARCRRSIREPAHSEAHSRPYLGLHSGDCSADARRCSCSQARMAAAKGLYVDQAKLRGSLAQGEREVITA